MYIYSTRFHEYDGSTEYHYISNTFHSKTEFDNIIIELLAIGFYELKQLYTTDNPEYDLDCITVEDAFIHIKPKLELFGFFPLNPTQQIIVSNFYYFDKNFKCNTDFTKLLDNVYKKHEINEDRRIKLKNIIDEEISGSSSDKE